MNPEEILSDIEEIVKKSEANNKNTELKHSEIIHKLSDVVSVIGEQSVENNASYERIAKILNKLPENMKQKAIKVTNFPKEFKVSNIKDIKFPKSTKIDKPSWLDELKNKETKGILGLLKQIKQRGIEVNVNNRGPGEAIAVRLSDGRHFYKAVFSAIASGAKSVFRTAGGVNESALIDDQRRLVVTSSPSVDTGIEGSPVTVGTTTVEMTFSGVTEVISIQSDHDNSGKIWFGPSTVDNTGANAFGRLAAGQSVSIPFSDSVTAIYAVSDTASQKVYKLAIT